MRPSAKSRKVDSADYSRVVLHGPTKLLLPVERHLTGDEPLFLVFANGRMLSASTNGSGWVVRAGWLTSL